MNKMFILFEDFFSNCGFSFKLTREFNNTRETLKDSDRIEHDIFHIIKV